MQTFDLFSSHRFLDFAESYQCGCIWHHSLGVAGESESVDGGSARNCIILFKTPVSIASLSDKTSNEADFAVWINWQIPEVVSRIGRKVAIDKGTNQTANEDDSKLEAISFPALPIEYIRSVVVSNENDRDALKQTFESLHQGRVPLNVEVDEQIIGERSPFYELTQIAQTASAIELSEFAVKWGRSARLARMFAVGLLQYRREGEGFLTNFDLSTHRANAFLQGVENPTEIRKRSLYAIDQKIGRKAAEVLGRSLKLSAIREPERYSMDELLEAVKTPSIQGELPGCEAEDLGGDPDKYLFRLVVNSLASEPLTPQKAGAWFDELLRDLEGQFGSSGSSKGRGSGSLERYLVEAKKVLAEGSRVSLPAFIARSGDRSPTLIALVTLFKSDRFDDAERLSQRVNDLNVDRPQVRWLVWILFGLQNGYKSILFHKYQKKSVFRESFLAAFKLLVVDSDLTSEDFASEPDFTIEALHASKDRNGAHKIVGKLAQFQELEIRVLDPDSGLSDRFIKLISAANQDDSLRRKILREFDRLAMANIPLVRELMNLEAKPKAKGAKMVTQDMVVTLEGTWDLAWTCEDQYWKKLSEELDPEILKKHIHDHNGAFENVLGSLEKGR